ncbi:hypothetical protein [Segniliparus rugosus]|uniref:Calpain catalytic domain-containing protein n=1 Tax=Segniliparus rugosus (strain ATCC BAA-974 / DSM 45345 / CCUG 50838 / CIP 108380 / JCM 13579 / CDC 945) TaxID=679197 RepID=E5XTT9_SEGRC|nr:hypothetical protein [Segniliparus rugosus]EFV12219.1 hypothetical protein HMPREF9336_02911 [Segniliparus rugosus ATCC BAA-974]
MIALRKSTLACVVATGLATAFLVAADKLPADAAIRNVPAPHDALVVSVPATAGQDHFSEANLWSSSGPGAEDVRQSSVGDCYFDAAMAAVAHTQPERIMNAINFDQATGNFIVRLYNYAEGRDYIPGTHGDGNPWPAGVAAVPVSVTVTQNDIKDDIRAGGASSLDDGIPGYIWPAVMEAAYAKILFGNYPTHPNAQGASGAVEAGLKVAEAASPVNPLWSGGDVDQGMATITGQTGTYTPAALSSYDVLASALAERRPVTMGTTPSRRLSQDRLVLNHQYTVMAISKDASGAIQLTVRNPWGVNDGVPGVQDPSSGIVVVDFQQALADKVIGSFDIGPAPGA